MTVLATIEDRYEDEHEHDKKREHGRRSVCAGASRWASPDNVIPHDRVGHD
jgi:hypothetical protein